MDDKPAGWRKEQLKYLISQPDPPQWKDNLAGSTDAKKKTPYDLHIPLVCDRRNLELVICYKQSLYYRTQKLRQLTHFLGNNFKVDV